MYCSAMSCGYSGVDNKLWEPLATLVLEASYEATLLAALCSHINKTTADKAQQKPHKVFLTFLGGGVFRNEATWIAHSIGRALAVVTHQCSSIPAHEQGGGTVPLLQVVICHHRRENTVMCSMIDHAFREKLSQLQGRPLTDV